MQYKNIELELKALRRQSLSEVRSQKPVMVLGLMLGLFIGYIFVTKYL